MNRRTLFLLLCLLLIAALALPVLAQSNSAPQALVNVATVVLRDAPTHAAGFVTALNQGAQVSLLEVDDSGLWIEVETTDGLQGWGRRGHFSPMSRARAMRTLTLFEAPDDNINFVTSVQDDEQVLVLETDDSGLWTRALAPDGLSGWTETILLRPDYGITGPNGASIRPWPDRSSDPIAALPVYEPVIVGDTLDSGWARVITNDGVSGWVPVGEVAVFNSVVAGTVSLTQSEEANLRAEPAVDARSIGAVANGETVLVIGRTASAQWLLVQVRNGMLAWLSGQLVDINASIVTVNVVRP